VSLFSVAFGLMIVAMFVSTLHLGRPRNAVRSLLNLRTSWLSREILLATVFLVATAVAGWPQAPSVVSAWAGWLTVPAAAAFLAGMAQVYMQRTVPVWNHWRTPLTFAATAVYLGGLTANALLWSVEGLGGEQTRLACLVVMAVCVAGVGAPWIMWRHRSKEQPAGPFAARMAGSLGVMAGLVLFVLLAARPESADGAAPLVLSWSALGLALVDQFGQRREYYDRYERLGV